MPPPAVTHTIGGTVSGLAGTGLVLQNNSGNNLAISANGSFTFTTAINDGTSYNVTVLTQPSSPAQTCAVTNGSGTATANVTNVQVTCTTVTRTIGGTVSGLAGTGLVLQNNGGNNLAVSANGSFTFTTAINDSTTYNVTVLTQPSAPAQICAVTNGSGTATGNVTNVQVTCTAITYTIGGTVSGLAGTGLVLQNNGGNNLTISANGSFTFTTAVSNGGAYNVTVLTQPSSPKQICAVTNGSGTANANITNVQVTCTTVTYTIGGTVVNLAGSGGGLVLQNNGGDNLLINANGSFTFATAINDSSTYNVTVLTQPSAPAQTCAVTNGSGTANANVTNVNVDCGHKQWTWMKGANTAGQTGVYGTLGTSAPSNVPGGRQPAAGWTDASGNFWVFGGFGFDSAGTLSVLNDLWKYSAGQWTWMAGSNLVGQKGTYGTQGTASASNYPGARLDSVSSTDGSGNVWLFGGNGYDSAGTASYLNDLWKYSAGQWTWMSGSNLVGQKGTYGTLGVASASNVPGARSNAVTWTDASGNLWLFGGWGYDSAGTASYLNDLWKYSAGQWTWMSGSNLAGQNGTYGTQGVASASNVPGARRWAAGWTDSSGNLWLFGGKGVDATGTAATAGALNDLWKYSGGQWTWMGGSNVTNPMGTYGTKGAAAASNTPGGRQTPLAWTDASGNVWLFGGYGYAASGPQGCLNDLWKYSGGQWTWMSGSNLTGQTGTYGTQGTTAPGNVPGGRWPLAGLAGWKDGNGNLWFFGGWGYDSAGSVGDLNDLWMYMP
ncbi:MAG: hypothetical protein LAN84_04525 [Acidobacteriia bacterium]|nr:hypothetical protein [Terriglobia bacterium]